MDEEEQLPDKVAAAAAAQGAEEVDVFLPVPEPTDLSDEQKKRLAVLRRSTPSLTRGKKAVSRGELLEELTILRVDSYRPKSQVPPPPLLFS